MRSELPIPRRIAGRPQRALVDPGTFDYWDTFAIRIEDERMPDPVPDAVEILRAGLERAPLVARTLVLGVWRYLLRFDLGPRSDARHVLGWRVVASEYEAAQLEVDSPIMRGTLLGRRDGGELSITTFVDYHGWPARVIWAVVSPVHRRMARYLLPRSMAPFLRDASRTANPKSEEELDG